MTHLGAVPGVRDTVWDQVQLAVPSNPKLKRNATADVVVVGAGIAGLSVAYNLAKAGKKVIVLESRAIGDNSFFLSFFISFFVNQYKLGCLQYEMVDMTICLSFIQCGFRGCSLLAGRLMEASIAMRC